MPRLLVFNNLSIDGFFTDADGNMGFAHGAKPDPEFDAYAHGNARGGGRLLFGRKTYEMMVGFWTTAAAKARMPEVADRMNNGPKIVVSRTLTKPEWAHTQVIRGDLSQELARLKAEEGPDIVILGSGEIVAQATAAGLVDEFHFVIVPVVLGAGRTLFEGLKAPLNLEKLSGRGFANGRIAVRYRPQT